MENIWPESSISTPSQQQRK